MRELLLFIFKFVVLWFCDLVLFGIPLLLQFIHISPQDSLLFSAKFQFFLLSLCHWKEPSDGTGMREVRECAKWVFLWQTRDERRRGGRPIWLCPASCHSPHSHFLCLQTKTLWQPVGKKWGEMERRRQSSTGRAAMGKREIANREGIGKWHKKWEQHVKTGEICEWWETALAGLLNCSSSNKRRMVEWEARGNKRQKRGWEGKRGMRVAAAIQPCTLTFFAKAGIHTSIHTFACPMSTFSVPFPPFSISENSQSNSSNHSLSPINIALLSYFYRIYRPA